MLDFNLEYCRSFYFVAKLGSISRAADALFLSQPAVTHSIKKLEERMKCKLFQRSSRGMQLSHGGEILFDYVKKAFDELMQGERELAVSTNYTEGKLTIGATETPLYYSLIPQIENFRLRYPSVYIHITGSSTPEIIRMIREEKIDLAIAVTPIPKSDDLDVIEHTKFHDIFIAGAKYLDLKNRALTAKEISEYPICTVEKGTSARKHIDRWFEEQGILFNPEYSVRTSTTVIPFAEKNLAIGIVPYMFAKESIQQGTIFQIRPIPKIPHRNIVLIHKKNTSLSELCSQLMQFLLKRN